MRCFSPMSVPRPNGAGSTDRITVPCGKCVACTQRRTWEWFYRLKAELRFSESAFFVTLTYDESQVPMEGVVVRDVQLFLKRARAHFSRLTPDRVLSGTRVPKNMKVSQIALKVPKMRYYLISEYGPKTMRPHYHGIFFNLPYNDFCEATNELQKLWDKGFVTCSPLNDARLMYCSMYHLNILDYQLFGLNQPFALMSKGIGKEYIDSCKKWHQDNQNFYGVLEDGRKVHLPRYFNDKIFSDYERRINSIKFQLSGDRNFVRQMSEQDCTSPFSERAIFTEEILGKNQAQERQIKKLKEKGKL